MSATSTGRFNPRKDFFSSPKGSDGPFGLGSIRRLGKMDLEIRIDQALPVRHSSIHCRKITPFHLKPYFLYDERLRWKCCMSKLMGAKNYVGTSVAVGDAR